MMDYKKCAKCRDNVRLDRPISMAFQPIINIRTHSIYAYEALVRGAAGEGAEQILREVSKETRYSFDQACRIKAIELASELGITQIGAKLSINFLPSAVYEPRACIQTTLAAAAKYAIPHDDIIFEFAESENIDTPHLLNILRSYRHMGFNTAIDDFGAGYAGLGLLSNFQPDIVKIDMNLVRSIDTNAVKRTILKGTLTILRDLNVTVLCEGVETFGEFGVLQDLGVDLMQGYLFGKPSFAALTQPIWPE